MASSYIERYVVNVVQDTLKDNSLRIAKVVNKLAAKQGGANMIENYQLLAKRSLVVAGATIATVQVVGSIVGFVISRKNEEKRVERIVRRVLDEERQKEEAEAAAEAEAEEKFHLLKRESA